MLQLGAKLNGQNQNNLFIQVGSINRSLSAAPANDRSLQDGSLKEEEQNQPFRRQGLIGGIPRNRPKSILKKGNNPVLTVYKNRPDNSMPERRNVKFEPRVKIHEFEKYLDQMSEFDEDEAGDDSSDNEKGYYDNQQSVNAQDDNVL